MDAPTKSDYVCELLARRVRHGDYLLKDFPTDRQLSAEFQVDTRTARKAVARLIESGLLVRQSNGRPAVAVQARVDTRRIAMLTVAYPSPYTWRWQSAIEQLAASRQWMFRPVTYTHLDDPIVADTLDGFDAAFIGLPSIDPTEHLLRTINRSRRPIVFLDVDLSEHGFPSLWLSSPTNTSKLLDHLAQRGHRRIACLNTQPHNSVTDVRLATWRKWTTEHGSAGRLVDQAVASFGSPLERAYHATKQTLADGGFDATALLCCTSTAAKGVYRALHEAGIEVGRDLAICSADDGAGEAPYFVPSLTALRDPDPKPYLEVCFDWFRDGRDWKGPLLVQPQDVPLTIGESTTNTSSRSNESRLS